MRFDDEKAHAFMSTLRIQSYVASYKITWRRNDGQSAIYVPVLYGVALLLYVVFGLVRRAPGVDLRMVLRRHRFVC